MIFLNIIFVLVCVLLMLSILLQSGKGEGLSGTFGGSSQFMGGRAAATFLTKTTTALAVGFMLFCILLSGLYSQRKSLEGRTAAQGQLEKTPAAQVAPPLQPNQGQSTPAPTPGGSQ